MTQLAIEVICAEMLVILERQAASQLPGGHYHQPSEKQIATAAKVPKTNTISERDMAVIDNLIRIKPSASKLTMETQTMSQKNRPFYWLSNLNEQEKSDILDSARKMAPEIKAKFQERKQKIQEQIAQRLKTKQQKVEMKEQKEVEQKTKYTIDIVQLGGVWALANIEENLQKVEGATEKEKQKNVRDAVLSQIKFQKTVLGSKGPRQLYQEQVKGKKYTTEELKENFARILEINLGTDDVEKNSSLTYHPIDDMKQGVEERKREVWFKVLEGRNKRRVKSCQEQLNRYLAAPDSLVGAKVKHKCEGDSGTAEWFDAEVLSVKRKTKEAIKTEYNIRYEEEENNVWFFPLLVDLKKGDLIIEAV